MLFLKRSFLALPFLAVVCAFAQDATGTLEGEIYDPASARVPHASVTATNAATGISTTQQTNGAGVFHFASLPVGVYTLHVSKDGFAVADAENVRIDVDRVIDLPVHLVVATAKSAVEVQAANANVDVSSTIGEVVSGHDVVDLPLNGRNITQLGLLQPGVAPMTQGVLVGGGIKRQSQAYSVNGLAPESNNYLLDGVSNVDSVNGGYALRTPPDAVSEFRILTSNAPPEYGETSGGTTSVVTRSGTNDFHGTLYDFFRNDALDARSATAQAREPLHRNQFGGSFGGPVRKNQDFFFAYYEGQRDREGETRIASVPSPAERAGNFSETGQPLINEFTGTPFPNATLPFINPVSASIESLIPQGNVSPTEWVGTRMLTNDYDQGGFRLDHYFNNNDQIFARYATAGQHVLDPFPISGSSLPGFPTADDFRTHSATISWVHLFSPTAVQTARIAFFRNISYDEQAQNHTPGSTFGFGYQPTLSDNTGVPYLIVSGFENIGNPITGPQDSAQNDYEAYYSLGLTRGTHNFKFGGQLDRQQMNAILGIATNGFFVFAGFPVNNPFASFLIGQPVVFFQGGGDFERGLRKWVGAAYTQDEWRVSPHLTVEYGVRWEVNTPYTDIRNRMNAWAPGQHSTVHPNAPTNLLFPGDPGVPAGIAPIDWKEWMPRIGVAYQPFGSAATVIRAGYGIFYDGFTNGQGGPLQAPMSALPWTQAYQLPGPGLNFADPYNGSPTPFATGAYVRPATVLTVQSGMKPPYSQQWNFSIEHSFANAYLFNVGYVGNKGTHLARFIEANPTLPGASNRMYADCNGQDCAFGSVGLIADNNASTYESLQASFSRPFTRNWGFTLSYWWSKSLDYSSSLNLSGSAPTLVAGENDLPQNPFDLRAEHGPSLFDATHRFVASLTYALPNASFARPLTSGWQINSIVTLSTGTPFTVYDSNATSLQDNAPEITGFSEIRPNFIGDPYAGAHTPDHWINASAFSDPGPLQYGNEGRNALRGPGFENIDLSLFKRFTITEHSRAEFRVESFNTFNHANYSAPVADLAAQNFGLMQLVAPPRQVQLALKLIF